MISVIGAKGKINDINNFLEKINRYSSEHNTVIQVMDNTKIVSKEHVIIAINHALRAIEKHSDKKSLAIEILMYSACCSQINKAIDNLGITEQTTEFCIVVVGDCNQDDIINFLGLKKFEIADNPDALKLYIDENKINSVTKPLELIFEQIALLEIER